MTFWNEVRTVVALEDRKPGPDRPPPLGEQLSRLRTRVLPMLELDLKNDLEHWLADVDTAVSMYRPHHFKRFTEAITYVHARRTEGRTGPGFESRWLEDPEAKKLKFWVPLRWDPLMDYPEHPVTEAEELMVMFGFRLEELSQQEFGWPKRARLWWRVIKAPDQESVESELARRVASRQINAVYRKVVLVATLRARADRWIIERLEWLDRPPGRR